MLNQKLIELKKEILLFASLIENMVSMDFKGLREKDGHLLKSVISEMEPKANGKELEIDELATNLIALFQPEAKDLRTILSIIKINNDLERIGDLSVNVAESSLYLIRNKISVDLGKLKDIENEILKMYKESIEAFVNEDTKLAMSVLEVDSIIDKMEEKVIDFFINFMSKEPSFIKSTMHIIRIAHNLERIGDLCTNICEDVIYIKQGKIIRHNIKV